MAEPEKTPKTAPEVPGDSVPSTPTMEEPTVAIEPDEATDSAVDDIVRNEADDELKAQDEAAEHAVVMKLGRTEKLKQAIRNWWQSPRKRWSTIAAILVVLIVVFAVPFIRYEILGLFVREKVTVQAVDSSSGLPVSGAEVQIGGSKAETDAEGRALLHPHTGNRQLQVSKKYYKGSTQSILVTTSAGQNVFKAKLVALGRQVKIKLTNKISGQPVSDAKVTFGGAAAKTDKNGMANLVLPSGATTQQAEISLNSYNDATVTVDANGDLSKNTFAITPSGKIYFLSNLSGTIDVVKTNLDGTDRQTVLAGTGNEDPNSTSLLASRDWKYLALLSKRSGSSASLYLIDTTNADKLTTIDSGNDAFTPVGWSDDKFVYKVDRSATVSDWQSNQQALKSFDPTSGSSLLLAQTQASGTNENDYAKQSFGAEYLFGSQVVYSINWGTNYNNSGQLQHKQAELDTINADGTNHRVIKTFADNPAVASAWSVSIVMRPYKPNGLYIDFNNGEQDSFYTYGNGTVTTNDSLTQTTFYQQSYPTYLLSPSSGNTFWADQRDGKNTLFVGDQNGDNQKQIADLSEYGPYGWFSDSYLLVSKGSSELYAMPVSGGPALKITDYYKPPINYNGYGGGYGGL